MKTIPLRYLADINPTAPTFDSLASDESVLFLPLEAVWNDSRADFSRRAAKDNVATGYVRFERGDVVSPKVTPTFQAGRSTLVPGTGAGSTELHVLRAKQGVDPRWVAYALRSKHFLEEGVTAFQGVAGLQRVLAEFLADYRVTDYPAEKQRRIADFLDDRVARINQTVAARRTQLVLVAAERASRFANLLNSRKRGSIQVRYLLERPPEYGLLPSEVTDDSMLARYVRTTDIGLDGYLRAEDTAYVSREYLTKYKLHQGDVLVARSGNTIGKCVVFEDGSDSVFAGYLVRLRFSQLDPWLYWYYTQTVEFADQLWENAIQSTIPNFNADRYASMSIPDLRQGQMVTLAALRDVEASTRRASALLEASIHLLQEYKQSLITAAVTGELDVTTASRKIPETL